MYTLVDDSVSSWDAQYTDVGHCPSYGGHPHVYMRDTGTPYGDVSALLGYNNGDHYDTFASLVSYWNLNNRFNDVWNSCA
jgi:hypothetical protein